MPVLVSCKFDRDPIIYERASVEKSFPHYIQHMRNFSSAQGRVTCTEVNNPIRLKFDLS